MYLLREYAYIIQAYAFIVKSFFVFLLRKHTGREVGIAYSEHPVEAVFLVTGHTQYAY